MDTAYIKEKLNMMLNDLIDKTPIILLSIFIFIIFYVLAEYYKSVIIPPKIKLKKSETEQIQQIRTEMKEEIKQEIKQEIKNEDTIYDDSLIYNQLSWLVYYSIIVFGLIVSLVNLGFNVATIIALLSSIGFTLGLALQDSVKNIISGIYISVNKLFKIGDIIQLKPLGNLNSTQGTIIDFSLYYTTIVNSNNIISMIPNSLVQSNILTNITLSETYDDE